GIVTFAANAAIVQMPTDDPEALNSAIDTLFLQRGTAVGSGILTSMDAIALATRGVPAAKSIDPSATPEPVPTLPPVPEGTVIPAIVILLTDGQNRNGPDPIEAAQTAAQGGVRAELDEETLRAIADTTGGKYYYAANETELEKIYANMGLNIVLKLEKVELTAWFTAVAALLLFTAVVLSMIWGAVN